MKLFHLSDLHLGKRLNEFSLLEDQEYILLKILKIVEDERPDAVLLAGDIYDKSMPSAEAVQLFDRFLTGLKKRGTKVFVISGNHDSAERIAFGAKLMDESGIFVSPVYDGSVEPITLTDAFGSVNFWLLPFVKPAHVRRFYGETEEITSYTDALRCAIAHMDIDPSERNVLLTHQFVTGAERSESEELSVGGTDNVDAEVFAPFDYVALGHIHGPQNIGRETLRYCGTPLKYSFSELKHQKSVTVIELKEKGSAAVSTIPLTPMRDLREVRGTYEELTLRANYEGTNTSDYMHIILTDEEDVPDAIGRLRTIYPNLMKLDYDNTRTRASSVIRAACEVEQKTETQLFEELFLLQNGQPMSDAQRAFCEDLFARIREEL